MRILNTGHLPGEREWRGRCHNCGCTVEFLQKEGTHSCQQLDGESCTIQCPTKGCGMMIYGELCKRIRLTADREDGSLQ